jgi:hypothetical protein
MARLRDLLDQKDRLRELDGWQVRKSLLGLRRSLGVFEGNTQELQAFLGEYDQAGGTLEAFDPTEPAKFEKFFDETDRLLHNFLAAAESLKDHAEKIKGQHFHDLTGDADTHEYRARERAVFKSPVGSFVTELRNHVLHERIPTTNGYLLWSSSVEFEPLGDQLGHRPQANRAHRHAALEQGGPAIHGRRRRRQHPGP